MRPASIGKQTIPAFDHRQVRVTQSLTVKKKSASNKFNTRVMECKLASQKTFLLENAENLIKYVCDIPYSASVLS